MASLSRQLVAKSSYLRAALLNNHANTVMNYATSSNKTSSNKTLSTNAVLGRKENVHVGVQRTEDFQQKKAISQQQRRPEQPKDNRDRDSRDSRDRSSDRDRQKEEGNRPSQPLILIPLNSLEDPSINRESLIEAARALQSSGEYRGDSNRERKEEYQADSERREESKDLKQFEPQRYDQLCDPRKPASRQSASRQNAGRQDASCQDSRQNSSRRDESRQAGANRDVAVVVPLQEVRAQSQRLEAERQARRNPSQRGQRGEGRSQKELVQAFLVSSEDGRAANNNDNNNPNKVALPLDDQIIQQLKCLSISGMNLDIITEVPDINSAIQRFEKCKALSSSGNKCPQESQDQKEIHPFPFEMETKINGTLLLSPQEMKESGLDQIDPDELNSRISNVTSNICLIALQNGLTNVQCFEEEEECSEEQNCLGECSSEPITKCEGNMPESPNQQCPSESTPKNGKAPERKTPSC